jgi:hypothetical protein
MHCGGWKARRLALLEYGEGSAFLGRFNILKKAISNLFVRVPNQEVEGKLYCFLTKVNDFAARQLCGHPSRWLALA